MSERTKRCPVCEEVKPFAEFPKNRSAKNGIGSYCKPCFAKRNRERQQRDPRVRELQKEWDRKHPERRKVYARRAVLKRQYGLTIEEYEQMLERQDGLCAICKNPPGVKGLFVDHDHDTGEIRELLCQHCNFALGLLDEDVARMHRACAYLLRHRKSKLEVI